MGPFETLHLKPRKPRQESPISAVEMTTCDEKQNENEHFDQIYLKPQTLIFLDRITPQKNFQLRIKDFERIEVTRKIRLAPLSYISVATFRITDVQLAPLAFRVPFVFPKPRSEDLINTPALISITCVPLKGNKQRKFDARKQPSS